jgi:hypothetical protein
MTALQPVKIFLAKTGEGEKIISHEIKMLHSK